MQPEDGSPQTLKRLKSVPSYEEFLRDFLLPNRPCILPHRLIASWSAAREWPRAGQGREHAGVDKGQLGTDDGSRAAQLHPAFDLLKERYGSHVVPVVTEHTGKDALEGTEEDQVERCEMALSEAVDRMKAACAAAGADRASPLVYIKDWHLVRQERQKAADAGDDAVAAVELPYETPDIFMDDWMNNGVIAATTHSGAAGTAQVHPATTTPTPAPAAHTVPDDFQFIYAGMPGTRTPLHRDVYTSYSWSTNLVGRKRWVLYPPTLADRIHAWLHPDRALEVEPEPGVDAASGELRRRKVARMSEGAVRELCAEMERRRVEVVQEEGETIFVPSNWFHRVENLREGEGSRREEVGVENEAGDEDPTVDQGGLDADAGGLPRVAVPVPARGSRGTGTISLNHNWCNSVNVPSMYEAMKRGMEEVEVALEDVRDMLREQGRQQQQQAGSTDGDRYEEAAVHAQPWQQEFLSVVQLVSRSDAGWDWAQFWSMVAAWLDPTVAAFTPPPTPTQQAGRSCPPHLHPDLQGFILPRVKTMLEDFLVKGPGGPEFADAWAQGWMDSGLQESVRACARVVGVCGDGTGPQR